MPISSRSESRSCSSRAWISAGHQIIGGFGASPGDQAAHVLAERRPVLLVLGSDGRVGGQHGVAPRPELRLIGHRHAEQFADHRDGKRQGEVLHDLGRRPLRH
jgi:hypothetical protein